MDPDLSILLLRGLSPLSVLGLSFEPGIAITEIVIFALLLLLSAIFSGSEVALFGLDDSVLEEITSASDRASRRVARLLQQPRELLVSILILNTVVNVTAVLMAPSPRSHSSSSDTWLPGP